MLKFFGILFLLLTAVGAVGAISGPQAGHRSDTARAAAQARPSIAHAPCRSQGTGGLVKPDDSCTPGEYLMLTRAEACRHKQRPNLSAATKRRIVRQYGYASWTGRSGEIDHRVPFFLGGTTTEDNLWPEVGGIPNTKDRLEFKVYALVCEAGTMTVRQAREVFLGDWTAAWREYAR